MKLHDIIHCARPVSLSKTERKIPWNEPGFSQRMLLNHLSQEHDWASRRFALIEQQVNWIAHQLPTGARILDLGCGPGFYTRRLAERGFSCTGVDFSPASVAYAQQQASEGGLNIDYRCEDVRTFSSDAAWDFIMMTFGELNVFSAAEVRALLSSIVSWLKPGGQLLLEVHTLEEIKRQGLAETRWETCPTGLFLDEPHLLLIENSWDKTHKTTATLWWVIDSSGAVSRFGNQMKGWSDEEYLELLSEQGLHSVTRLSQDEWPSGEAFADKLYVLHGYR